MSKGKILMLKIKSACYDSTFWLADLYGRALERLGYEVEYFSTAKEPVLNLERFIGKKYDAVIDFNSLATGLDTEEGEWFFDKIEAPFYDYILDHPMYHNKQLKVPLKNFRVLCLDYDHEEYIRKYYPHIKSVHTLPLFALPLEPEMDGKEERNIDVLFMGTYMPSNQIYEQINSFDKPLSNEMKGIAEILMENTHLTQEQALLKQQESSEFWQNTMNIRDRLYAYFLADVYVKAHYREKMIEAALKSGRKVIIYGEQWNLYENTGVKNLEIHKMVAFGQTPEVMRRAKICLNIMPWFKAGIHDRVFTAMNAGAAVLTDNSRMLKEEFEEKKDILIYDLNRMEQIPGQISYALENEKWLENLAQNGRKKVIERHSLEKRAEQLSVILSQNNYI